MDPRVRYALGVGRRGVRHSQLAVRWRTSRLRQYVRGGGVWLASAGVLAAGLWWAFGATLPGSAPAEPPAAVATLAPDEAEQVYLSELAFAGLQLSPEEQQAAVEIAREHVAHGHLVGMRHWILSDFAERIPRLTEEQRDVARVAVEHHFQDVTGRKQ